MYLPQSKWTFHEFSVTTEPPTCSTCLVLGYCCGLSEAQNKMKHTIDCTKVTHSILTILVHKKSPELIYSFIYSFRPTWTLFNVNSSDTGISNSASHKSKAIVGFYVFSFMYYCLHFSNYLYIPRRPWTQRLRAEDARAGLRQIIQSLVH